MRDVTEKVAANNEVQKSNPVVKAEKFVWIEEYRMNRAIEAIGRLENLANRLAYEYTPEQVESMFSILESKMAEVKAKFTAIKAKENATFSFGSKA